MGDTRLLSLLFSFSILLFISCEGDTSGVKLKKCVDPGDCKASQHCKFDSIEDEKGVCTVRQACIEDETCKNNLKCVETFEKSFCGTRSLFTIKDIVLDNALKDADYVMTMPFEVENNSSLNYSFSLVDKDKLPAGLSLVEGKLTGRVTSEAGDYKFSLKATNGNEDSTYYLNYREAIKEFTIKVIEYDCPLGYTGENCDACASDYYDKDGTCVLIPTCSPNPCTDKNKNICSVSDNILTCSCNTGHKGSDCKDCKAGFHHDEHGNCQADESCTLDTCTAKNKTTCKVIDGIASCFCDTGYSGGTCSDCETGYHEDINEPGSCVIDETCTSTSCNNEGEHKTECDIVDGMVTCSCEDGFYEDEGGSCQINEVCQAISCTDQGEHKTDCTVLEGRIKCLCKDGYYEDESGDCQLNEVCQADSCQAEHRVCVVPEGRIECICAEGYYEKNGVCVENLSISFCNIQYPIDVITANNTGVWGNVQVDTLTDGDRSDLVKGQLCYFLSSETDANSTCVDATFSKNINNTSRDQYGATLTVPENGNYSYYYQFKVEGFTDYEKCDLRVNNGDEGTNYANGEDYEGLTGTANINDVPIPQGNLFISEYIEGKANNKYLELYAINGLVNLNGWKVRLAVNEVVDFSTTINLNDVVLEEGSTYVLANADALDYAEANQNSGANQETGALTFNGNDTVGLFNPDNELVDIIGYQRGDEVNFAESVRLIRKPNILIGNTVYNPDEYYSTPVTGDNTGQLDDLGSHTIAE